MTVKQVVLKFLVAASATLAAFFIPIQKYLYLVGIAITLDMFIAIWAAIKEFGHEGFQSSRLKDSGAKTFIYVGCIILMHQAEKIYEVDFLVKTVTTYFLITELRSIDEKYYRLYGKSIFKWIIDRLPNMNKEKTKSNARNNKNI